MDQGGYALAYAFSNAAGLRPFVTLAVFAWMMEAGSIHPDPHFAWLGYRGVAITLTVLAGLEFLGDKIPVVDHLLHVFDFVSKPAAAALMAGGAVHFQHATAPDNAAHILVMLASAANALGLHAVVVSLRGTTTAFTFGAGNPIVSIFEDVACVIALLIAIFVPILGVAIAIAATILSFKVVCYLFGKWHGTRSPI